MKKRYLPFAFTVSLLANSLFSQSWTPVGNNVLPGKYYTWALSAVDENTVYAICVSAGDTVQKLIRTTNGGVDWDVTDLSVLPGLPMDIHAISADTIWIVYRESSGITKLYLSTDAAQTWQQKHSYQGNNVVGPALAFGDKESGYMVDPSVNKASRTSNGGNSWQTGNMPSFVSGETWGMPNPTNWMDAKGDTIWWGTNKFIRRSTNNGLTWQSISNGFSGNVETKCISFSQCGFGLAASNVVNVSITGKTHISASTDGGTTWKELPILDIPLEGISDVPGLPGAFVGVGGIFKDFVPNLPHQYFSAYTLDGGLNWTVIDSFPLNAVEFVSPEAGWAGTILSHDYGGNPLLFKWTGSLTHNRIYVNQNATGANTGTSWVNAYTDLQTALTAAQDGFEIWVAEGTYKPAAPGGASTSTFLLNKTLSLYGGFAGTECYFSERDIVAHPSVLSGDLNGNDVDDDFSAATRSDNVQHVLTISAAATLGTEVDGFTIQGGQADGGASPNGGGIHCQGAPDIRRCIFRQNMCTSSGAGVFVSGFGAQGLVMEYCKFEKNLATNINGGANGGGMSVSNVKNAGVIIRDCIFMENTADNKGGLEVQNSNGVLERTSFSGNFTKRQGGGLRVGSNIGNDNLTFKLHDCTFENNKASFGGAIHFLIQSKKCNVEIINTKFLGNAAENMQLQGWGYADGGISFAYPATASDLQVHIDSCLFEGNASASSQSAIGLGNLGTNMSFNLTNSVFRQNTCMDYGAVGLWPSGNNMNAIIENCVFEDNVSQYGSGGLDIGPADNAKDINYSVRNCIFRNNRAARFGGGLTLWSGNGSKVGFTVEDCLIEGNSAGERAGGVWILAGANDFNARFDRCIIRNNDSPCGSAMGTYQLELTEYILPVGATVSIENSLIEGNTSSAAIVLDSFPGFRLINSTIAHNHGGIQVSDSSGVQLQNTILYNPGYAEYQALSNDVTFTSNGGNLIGDLSLNGQLLPSDKENLDPVFVGAGDYHLTAGSPCVNAGNNEGVTASFDLDGNMRIVGSRVDMGAYESGVVPAQEVLTGEITLSPNPASAFLNIQLPEEITGPFVIEVYSPEGKQLRSQSLIPGQQLDVQGLVPATYALKVLWNERVYAGKFVKQW